MKVLLEGKTQEQIEEMFSMKSIQETLQVAVELFINEVHDEHIQMLEEIVGDDAQLLIESVIAMIGNPYVYFKLEDNARWTPAKALAKGIAKTRIMKKHYDNIQERMFWSLEVLKRLDGVLYDIEYLNVKIDDEYRKIAHCKIEFQLDTWAKELPFLRQNSIPLIERPLDWTENQSGGYHLLEQKPTLNLGAAKQPQQVLDILNILQHNKFTLLNDANAEEFYDYFVDKMLLKYEYKKADEIARMLQTSFELILNTIREMDFYFEWKYDFRGRIYSTGYAINLQSDKYRKGIITPVIKGRVTIK